jgi:hypothetical protein
MSLLLPNEVTNWRNLVNGFLPPDWQSRVEEAVSRTLTDTRKTWDDDQKSKNDAIEEEYDDDGCPMIPPPNMSGPPCTELPEWCVTFIEKLPQCTAMHFGFHVTQGNNHCYCPCSKKMETWRRQFGLEDIPQCNAKKSFSDSGLGQHLNTPHQVEGMDLHKIAYNYLVIIYGFDRLCQR